MNRGNLELANDVSGRYERLLEGGRRSNITTRPLEAKFRIARICTVTNEVRLNEPVTLGGNITKLYGVIVEQARHRTLITDKPLTQYNEHRITPIIGSQVVGNTTLATRGERLWLPNDPDTGKVSLDLLAADQATLNQLDLVTSIGIAALEESSTNSLDH